MCVDCPADYENGCTKMGIYRGVNMGVYRELRLFNACIGNCMI